MKLYDVPNVDRPLMLDEDFAETQGYSEHVDDATPKRNASKQEWADFAISKGGDPAWIETLTKSELVEQYGG